MLFFHRDNQEQIFLNNLPKGRIYKQAKIQGTNFNKFIKWIAKGFEWLVDRYNETFKGLYICKSTFLIEQFKKDYSIPNEIFYQTTDEEHQQDIIVLRHLMRGNTAWNFKAIANTYGICVEVKSGIEFFKQSRLPNKIPHKLYSNFENVNNVMVVSFYADEVDILPHAIPHKLGAGLKIPKMKKLYDIIKPAQTKIIYIGKEQGQCEKINICVGA